MLRVPSSGAGGAAGLQQNAIGQAARLFDGLLEPGSVAFIDAGQPDPGQAAVGQLTEAARHTVMEDIPANSPLAPAGAAADQPVQRLPALLGGHGDPEIERELNLQQQVDTEGYEDSWNEAAEFFKGSVTREQWQASMQSVSKEGNRCTPSSSSPNRARRPSG